MTTTILHGDCRQLLAAMPDASVHAIVTDPPYEIGFMGKGWDAAGIAYDTTLWAEALRVLTPGGHLLAFGATRTYHRMTAAIEDAGFEIRDSIHWLYGSGFPKSLDVSKAIDKAAGAKREVVGVRSNVNIYVDRGPFGDSMVGAEYEKSPITAPATEAARKWSGFGTALKPAHEPIVVARKPLVGTVAANVLAYGTGALNIDATRIAVADDTYARNCSGNRGHSGTRKSDAEGVTNLHTGGGTAAAGRWPANLLIDDVIAGRHPEWGHYFYVAKPSRRERNAGLDGLPEVKKGSNFGNDGARPHTSPDYTYEATTRNIHPTVKPITLMRWLVRLVTPPGGIVLDPFTGSGTTGVAAVLEGFDFIGCEMTDEYLPIIEGRLAWAKAQTGAQPEPTAATPDDDQPSLFGNEAA